MTDAPDSEPNAALDGRLPPSRFPTIVRNVEEVSLVGTARLDPWRAAIEASGVHPWEPAPGRVEVRLLACGTKFKGIPFAEVSMGLTIAHAPGGPPAGAYLDGSFNSVRFFAWIERVVFKTPYQHAQVDLSAGTRPGFAVVSLDRPVLTIQAHEESTDETLAEAAWAYPIYLPPKRPGDRRFFFGRLLGPSVTRPFDPAQTTVSIRPGEGTPALARLAASGFQPTHWQLRRGAEHGKSKTYKLRNP